MDVGIPSGFKHVSDERFLQITATMDYTRDAYSNAVRYHQKYGDKRVFGYVLRDGGCYLHPDMLEEV